MSDDVPDEFCLNSRRWIIYMVPHTPRSCPYHAPSTGYACVGERCAYYQQRPPSAYQRSKWRAITHE